MFNLYNLNVWTANLPNELFQNIKKECFNYANLKIHKTGLTQEGVPKSYVLESNKKALCDYLKNEIVNYSDASNYLQSLTVLTKNTNLVFTKIWINIQRKNEFIPIHKHDGVFSFTLWINIPQSLNEESLQGSFNFVYSDILGRTQTHKINLDKNMEGKLLIFPSHLNHCVYPFHNSDELRISISGNVCFYTG